MSSAIELRPTYWACVSGGKDSFYMLYLILQHLDEYPLDGVVHYQLEIDYPFIKDVIDLIEDQCRQLHIPVFRIQPRKSWIEHYNTEIKSGKWKGSKKLYPTRLARWCNSHYKLDCARQLEEMMKAQGKRVINYIGFCYDEPKRFKYDLHDRENNVTQIYPLAEMGVYEEDILEWAKQQPIYNGFYLENRRCGCMGCPMSSMNDFVYLKEHYPEQFDYFMGLAKETEEIRGAMLGRQFSVWGPPKYDTDYKIKRVNEIIELKDYKRKKNGEAA